MWLRLQPPDYATVRPLLDGLDYNLILTAVLEYTAPAQVFVDDAVHPQSAFLSTPEGNFLVGAADNAAFNQAFQRHVTEHIFSEDDYVVLEFANPAWAETVNNLLNSRVVEYGRYHYTFRQPKIDWRAALPDGYVMTPVTADLLARPSLKNSAAIIEGINGWNSADDFLQRGVGMCLLHGETIVSWCLADCASRERIEIGIHTDPAYQRHGHATLAVAATVEAAQAHGYQTIGWHCWVHNIASWKLAEKVGFEREREYSASMALTTDARYFTECGLKQSRQGDYQAALDWYEKALASEPDFDWAQVLAGGAHAQLGDPAAALSLIGQALEHGWPHTDYLRTNALFEPLRQHAEWEALLTRYSNDL